MSETPKRPDSEVSMKKFQNPFLVLLLLLVLVPVAPTSWAMSEKTNRSTPAAKASLPRSSPEQQGISSADLLAFVETADKEIDTMNSFMLVRHGHVVAEGWWTPY